MRKPNMFLTTKHYVPCSTWRTTCCLRTSTWWCTQEQCSHPVPVYHKEQWSKNTAPVLSGQCWVIVYWVIYIYILSQYISAFILSIICVTAGGPRKTPCYLAITTTSRNMCDPLVTLEKEKLEKVSKKSEGFPKKVLNVLTYPPKNPVYHSVSC